MVVIHSPGSADPGNTMTFIVEVREDGSPVSTDETVTFSITSGDGNAWLGYSGTETTRSDSTSSNGRASATIRLGTRASGSYTVTASTGSASVSVTATVKSPPPPPPIPVVQGGRLALYKNPSGTLGPGESVAFTVEVTEDGVAVPGETLTFSLNPDDGTASLSTTSATTDSSGRASTTLTLGSNPASGYAVSATDGVAQVSGTVRTTTPPSPPSRPIVLNADRDSLNVQPGDTVTFTAEVRENGSPVSGQTVTFSVDPDDGGVSLSTTSATTDSNGQAQTTLTTGSDSSRAYWVVAAVGNKSVSSLLNVETSSDDGSSDDSSSPLLFDLSVPSGISLIHIPLKVRAVDGTAQTIESVGDLYDTLGGVNTVKLLTTYNRDTLQWNSYLGEESRGDPADRVLTDDLGIIASLKTPVSVRLSGDALGVGGMSTISLNRGTNLVGLPLKNSRISRVSDLFALDGIVDNVSAITTSQNGTFKVVRQADDDGNISVTGSQAFILTASENATFTISGDGWGNISTGAMTAPPLATENIQETETTPVLVLSGSIVDGVKRINRENLRVIVKNLSTGSAIATMIEDTGGTSSQVAYQLTVLDIEGGRAAAIGDILEVSAMSTDDSIGVRSLRYTVTAENVRHHRIQLLAPIAQAIPMEAQLLPNYPNPFNPETWIPYRLAEDAFVTLTIYDQSGQIVRTLDVGHRVAAFYETRSKAIYWDGRNEIGEQVASGVYFYHLSAGDYSAARKMLILK